MAICDDYMTHIDEAYEDAVWYYNLGDTNRDWLTSNYIMASWNRTWRENVTFAIARLYSAVEKLIWGSRAEDLPLRVPYYLRNCTGADEPDPFSMNVLLSTMVAAEPDDVMYFVGLVDAYRQSVWNKPFNQEYFASLARGFEIWP